MYYYNITEFNEFKERKRDGVLYQYALLEDYDLKTLKKVLQNPDSDTKGDYLRELTEVYNRNEINEYQYIRLCKAIADGKFAIKTKLKEPLFYVHVLPKETEGYLNANENALDGFYFDTKKQWGGSQTKFTKEEIEELKKYPQLKGINFDECLEEVEE
ncbi:hypothetical protein SN811_08370 [Ligilactobacillus agilis]|uniref:DUF1642 domain-containing protein n=1 Tax=Ligilactobacillus agilis TaxID=1601 RepID=A0A6F9Y4F1_9LACO|nr:hypothetical protein [Ligilactobacillus agilis]GET12337.1 hypothetical protein SN811_08370 [Ligilactobacillus agilis]